MTHPNDSGRRRLLFLAVSCAVGLAAVAAAAFVISQGAEQVVDAVVLPVVVSSERLDFGDVPLRRSVKRQLLLRNDSDEPITAHVKIDGQSGYLVEPDELILHPGISSRVLVAVRPDQPGPLNDTLRIDFGNANAIPIVVSLDGTAGDDVRPAAIPDDARLRVSNDAADADPAPTGSGAADDTARRVVTATPGRVTVSQPVGSATPTPPVAGTTGPASSATLAPTVPPTTPPKVGDTSPRRAVNPVTAGANATFRRGLPNDVPFVGIADTSVSATRDNTATPAARELPSRVPGSGDRGLPADLPDDLVPDRDDDLFDDIWDDDDDDQKLDPEANDDADKDPSPGPMLRISGVSTVRAIGGTAGFYPQAIPIAGGAFGGSIGLGDAVRFPAVGLAFGESVLINQVGPAAGSFDAGSGQLSLQVPIHVLDNDGDAAPIMMTLTSGISANRNAAGVLVQMTGSPRDPSSGLVRIVAVEKVPVGFRVGAEDQLVIVEILATLTFDDAQAGGLGGF